MTLERGKISAQQAREITEANQDNEELYFEFKRKIRLAAYAGISCCEVKFIPSLIADKLKEEGFTIPLNSAQKNIAIINWNE
jgi:hypothetical protein